MRHILVLLVLISAVCGLWYSPSREVDGAGSVPYGSFPVRMNVLSDPYGHALFIQMPANIKLTLSEGSSEDVFSGPAPFIAVGEDLDKDAFGEYEVNMSGSGSVAGHQDVQALLTGNIIDGVFTGIYTLGGGMSLPGGPIEYRVKAKEDTPTPTSTQPAQATSTPAPTSTPGANETPVEKLLGDVNGDGNVDAIDGALILQYAAALLSHVNPGAADVNHSDVVDVLDAALVLQYSAGLIDSLPPH
jgi:hypothetical protein